MINSPNGSFTLTSTSFDLSARIEMSQLLLDSRNGNGAQGTGNSRGVDGQSVSMQSMTVEIELSLQASMLQVQGGGRGRGGNQLAGLVREAGQNFTQNLNAQFASFNFNLSLDMSMTSLMTSGGGESANMLEDVELDAATEDLLAGYLSLMENLSSDDQMAKIVDRLRKALEGLTGGGGGGGKPVDVPNPEQVAQGGGQQTAQAVQIRLEVNMEGEIVSVQQGGKGQKQQDPIVFDLDGDGVEMTSAADGVDFDITGDGVKERTAFATGGDGVLVLDRNGNGAIDSGRELFGDQNGAANGFEELAKYDDNQDGVIDNQDSVYDRLQIWAEANGDGISQAQELQSLEQLGIASIRLNAADVDQMGTGGNRLTQVSSYVRTDGSQGQAVDALFNYMA